MTKFKDEDDLRSFVAKALEAQKFAVQIIESGGTGLGISDLTYANPRFHGWIEFKYMKRFGATNKIDWKPGQRRFLRTFARACCNDYLFVGFEERFFCIQAGKDDLLKESYTMDEVYEHSYTYDKISDLEKVFEEEDGKAWRDWQSSHPLRF